MIDLAADELLAEFAPDPLALMTAILLGPKKK
jgi:hypothetical protein